MALIDEKILTYIKQKFPITPTDKVAKDVQLSTYQVRSIAKKRNIKKCPDYLKRQRKELMKYRRKWYENSIPDFKPNFEQEQIKIGRAHV